MKKEFKNVIFENCELIKNDPLLDNQIHLESTQRRLFLNITSNFELALNNLEWNNRVEVLMDPDKSPDFDIKLEQSLLHVRFDFYLKAFVVSEEQRKLGISCHNTYCNWLLSFDENNQKRWNRLMKKMLNLDELIREVKKRKFIFNKRKFNTLLMEYVLENQTSRYFYNCNIDELIGAINIEYCKNSMSFFENYNEISPCAHDEKRNEIFSDRIEKMRQSITDIFELITLFYDIKTKLPEKQSSIGS